MVRLPSLLVAAGLITACSLAPSPAPTPAAASPAGQPRTWKQVMHEVGERFEFVDAQLRKEPAGDLDAIAQAATQAADLVRGGYGPHENPRIPGFANLARETEGFLLQLAMEAGQQHLDLARNLMVGAEARYCGRCHDAAERHGQ